MLRPPSKKGNADGGASRQARWRSAQYSLWRAFPLSGCAHDAGAPFHGGRPPAEMQDRTLAGQCRMDGLPRKLRAAIQSKLRLHLTPIWEGESNPDTTLRVKREQPAAKRRFRKGTQLYLNGPQRQAVRARRCPIDTIRALPTWPG